MKSQSYKNHIRYYSPHHFVYYPIVMTLLAISIYFSWTKEDSLIWVFISVIFVLLFFLAFMLRQHYGLTLQNRMVHLELRYRHFSLTGKRLEDFEHQLNDDQLFALRFASDDELSALTQRALNENLSGKEIKKAIHHWKADHERV